MSVYSDPHHSKSTRNIPLSDDHYLQIRKIFHEMAKSLALKATKRIQHRNQSMKLKAKKGRKNYRG